LAARVAPGRGDVDHQFGRARRRRALGGPAGLGDPVVGDAVAGEERPRLAEVLGGHPHAPAGAAQVVVRHLLQVGHGLHVEPALRHRGDQVGAAEAERAEQQHPAVQVLAALAQQVLAGDAHVDLAGVQGLGDVGGRQQAHLGARHAAQAGQIAARAAGHFQRQAAVGQPGLDLFLQPALGRDSDDEPAHVSPPA
jgi:hypothetical protein